MHAQGGAAGWDVSAALAQRRLVERADDGARLLTERGPMLRLQLGTTLGPPHDGRWRLEFGAAAGRLDYDGQTQGGAPVATDVGHRDLAAALLWRAWPATSRGEFWLGLRVQQQRRQIASTALAGGLNERSLLLLPALRWSGPGMAAGSWTLRPSVEARISVHHDLRIRFGGAYDDTTLDGGRRRELALGLSAAREGSPWRWGIAWVHARQAASDRQPLLRAGAPVGTVRQPRLQVDDLSVQATRAF